MPKLTGIFSTFPDIDQILPEQIARWLKPNPGALAIENYIGNKILYPQTIPVTQADLALELAILREIIRRHPTEFRASPKRFNIPQTLVSRLPNLAQLVLALVDAFSPKDVVEIQLGKEIIGSVVKPECPWPGSKFSLDINGKSYKFKKGSLSEITLRSLNTTVHFNGMNAKLFGKNEVDFIGVGGRFGLLIDGRGL